MNAFIFAAAVKPRDDTQNHRIERSPQRCGAERCGADDVPLRYEASCEPALKPSTEPSPRYHDKIRCCTDIGTVLSKLAMT